MRTELRTRLTSVLDCPVAWGAALRDASPPFVVLTQVSGGADYAMEGATGFRQVRVQVDAYATSYGAVEGLAATIRTALGGWSSGDIQGVFLDSERDLGPDTDIGEMLFRRSLDFMISYTE